MHKKYHPALLAHALKCPRESIMPWDTLPLTPDLILILDALQSRFDEGEPLSKIIGMREFWSREFKVTKDTLDPRADSETLIQAALDLYSTLPQPLNILELGVGTGCLLITLLLEMNHVKNAVGVDISEKALNIARENAQTYNIQNCKWIASDWFQNVPREAFSLIITNPPYIGRDEAIDDNVRNFDPDIALFAENHGLSAYQTIANDVMLFLKDGGMLICEIGHLQRKHVTDIFTSSGLILKKSLKDLAGNDRCLVFAKEPQETVKTNPE